MSKIYTEVDKSKFPEIKGYSITPTTFKTRSIPGSDLKSYKDEFEYGKFSVDRYGIYSPEVTKGIPDTDKVLSQKADTKTNKSNLSNILQDKAKKVIYQKIEEDIINTAIEEVFEQSDKKFVLVDILNRDNNGKLIQNDNTLLIETHTVLLYRKEVSKGEYKVLVVDPSNFTYSSHLSKLQVKVGNNIQIETLPANVKIYSRDQDRDPGPDFYEFRDCIDIAVKLAFALQHTGEDIELDKDKIEEYIAVKMVSNGTVIPREWNQARIKQTSDMTIVDKFEKCISNMDSQLKKMQLATGLKIASKVKEKLKIDIIPPKQISTPDFQTILDTVIQDDKDFKKIYDDAFQEVMGEVLK